MWKDSQSLPECGNWNTLVCLENTIKRVKFHLEQPGQAKERVDASFKIEELQGNKTGNIKLKKKRRYHLAH